MTAAVFAFASVVAVSLVSLVGVVTIALDEARVRRLATLFISFAVGALLGDAVHNFIDGVVIGASYLVSPTLGVSTTMAVLLHEIPQEFGDFGILIHSGLSVRKALRVNLGSASVAILGTALSLLAASIAQEAVTSTLVPLTAGGFVYLAAADLIPELQHDRSLRALIVQTILISSGIAVMGFITFIE